MINVILALALLCALYMLHIYHKENEELREANGRLLFEKGEIQRDAESAKYGLKRLKYLLSMLDNPKASEIVILDFNFVPPEVYYQPMHIGGGRYIIPPTPPIPPSYHIKMYGDGRIELNGDGHNTDDFKPSNEQELQHYVRDRDVCLFYKLLQKQKCEGWELKECRQKLIECQKRLNAVDKVVQNHKLRNKIMSGGRVYLSGPMVLERIQQDGKYYIGVYGAEAWIRKDILGMGGLRASTGGEENVLIDIDNKRAFQYILDRAKIINIYDR